MWLANWITKQLNKCVSIKVKVITQYIPYSIRQCLTLALALKSHKQPTGIVYIFFIIPVR